MKPFPAMAALVVLSSTAVAPYAWAQATGGTAATPAAPPATSPMAPPSPARPPATPSASASAAAPAGAQTPAAAVNTTAQTQSPSPSAVQTTNTTHRTAAAPVPGRNSFTMNQATRRITAAGYSKVMGLKKDNQGIWRGNAEKDGNSVAVSLDYQGNVTAQ